MKQSLTSSSIRVRFAPSPTGYLHIGGARTALFNYMFARSCGGAFLLRIEDTDQARSTKENVQIIMDALKWLELEIDEEPVFQSARLGRYREALEILVASDLAYEFEDERGKCMKFRMPPDVRGFKDEVLGDIDNEESQDFVIMKSDGFPTFHLANVVDDHDMGITHVMRGVDHKTNTVKHAALYKAFGWEVPAFAHIPLIYNDKGRKMSKRDGAISVTEYRKMGFLPQALRNFLALLGWSPGNDREIMPWDEMIQDFSLARIRKSPARFDMEKLAHFNQHYLNAMTADTLAKTARPFLEEAGFDLADWTDERLALLAGMYQEGLKTLSELPGKTAYFFCQDVEYNAKAVRKVLCKPQADEILAGARQALGELEDFQETGIEKIINNLCERFQVNMGKVAQPLRVAVTGNTVSPGIYETLVLLGKEASLRRIDCAIRLLEDRKEQPCPSSS